MSGINRRIQGLDYIRGVACLMVIFYHYTTRFIEIYPQYSEEWKFEMSLGYIGVSAFFLLSGYLAIGGAGKKQSLNMYIKKKIIRLYPCYWIGIILTFVVTKILLADRSVSLIEAVINLTMLQSFLGVNAVDGAYWTLANELIFYGFVALILIKLKQNKNFYIWGIAWLIIQVVAQILLNKNTLLYLVVNKLLMVQYAHMFLAGGFVFCIFNENSYDRKNRILMKIALCVCIVMQFLIFGIEYGIFFLLEIIFLIGIIQFEKKEKNYPDILILTLKPLSFIASISYPLYLIHQNIGYAIIIYLYKIGIHNEMIIIIPFIVMVVVSYIIHNMFEIKIVNKEKIDGKN